MVTNVKKFCKDFPIFISRHIFTTTVSKQRILYKYCILEFWYYVTVPVSLKRTYCCETILYRLLLSADGQIGFLHFLFCCQIAVGRSTRDHTIDVDLSLEGPAVKVSRKQATIRLRNTGDFFMSSEGKRPIFVDGRPVLQGNKVKLNHNSVIEV